MRIKRYFAADMRQAIRLVREEQGPDAVILSNRRVDGGVEIVAALDYDEELVNKMAAEERRVKAPEQEKVPAAAEIVHQRSEEPVVPEAIEPSISRPVESPISWTQEPSLLAMKEEIKTLRGMLEGQLSGLAWGEMGRRHPLYTSLFERLMRLGLSPRLCRNIADRIEMQEDNDKNWLSALGVLARHLPVTGDDVLNQGGVIALVGPTGVGKTTTVAKLAARFTLRHGPGRVALVTTDSFRIGAYQQLRTYGRILGVPVHVARDNRELHRILESLRDVPLVLIDTAGMSQRDMRLSEQFAMLRDPGLHIRSYVVLSTTTQRSVLDDVVKAFGHLSPAGCILTKLDESAVPGEALSVVVNHQLPVAYVSDGQRVPEDLHPARANNLVNRSVKLMTRQGESQYDGEGMALMFGKTAQPLRR